MTLESCGWDTGVLRLAALNDPFATACLATACLATARFAAFDRNTVQYYQPLGVSPRFLIATVGAGAVSRGARGAWVSRGAGCEWWCRLNGPTRLRILLLLQPNSSGLRLNAITQLNVG